MKKHFVFAALLIHVFYSTAFVKTADANTINGRSSVAVMAPLYVQPDARQSFNNLLKEAKKIGVQSVSVDVWWGLVFKNRTKPDWTYYDWIFQAIVDNGLKISPILSIHKCGGGPGDNCLCKDEPPRGQEEDCAIPIPKWFYSDLSREAGYQREDLMYESETGEVLDDAIPPWVTEQENSKILEEIGNFYGDFADRYSSAYAAQNHFAEINLSLGPTGELRYPSYNKNDGWTYPDRGFFQSYSAPAQDSFRSWAKKEYGSISSINEEWNTSLSNINQIRPPEAHLPADAEGRASGFVQRKDYHDTQYGIDFIDWYSSSLIEHGKRLLLTANEIFTDEFANVPIGMKIPGIHWQMKCTNNPRISEITAGLIKTQYNLNPSEEARKDAYGYKDIFEMITEVNDTINDQDNSHARKIVLHFTALEMDNDMFCGVGNEANGTSMAEALVFWISHASADYDIKLGGENALACVGGPDDPRGDNRNWGQIRNAFEYGSYSGFTLLRLEEKEKGCNPWDTDKNYLQEFIEEN